MVYRAVLAGCGSMARGWLKAVARPALRGRVEVVGLVDTDLNAAKRLREEAGLAAVPVGTSLDDMLTELTPEILFDVAIPAARRGIVAIGLERGCHVLSEKPMAASLEEARELVRLTAEAGKIHAIVQNRRYIEGVRRIRRLLDSGALGELTELHADFFIGAHFGGFREAMPSPLLLDMAIHTFDAARFMSGMDAQTVYCREVNPSGSWYAHGAAANAIFELGDSVVFTYRGSWAAEGANTSWESEWRVIGTRGTLLWDGGDHFDAHVVNGHEGFLRPLAEVEVLPAPDAAQTHGHTSVIAAFLDAIDNGHPPETAGSDNIKSLAMALAAIDSARKGVRVPVTV